MKSIFTKEQIDYLKMNYNKMSYKEIAIEFNLTERQIRGKINGMGLTKTRSFNKSYFKNIKSPNQAYWLGFIYADGYVIHRPKTGNHELGIELGIELKDTDNKLLCDFNKELGNAHDVTFRHNIKNFNGYDYETDSCLIRIYSKEIVEDLMRLDIYQNKTNRIEFPVCDEYFWDFLRGFMDGDGCIYVNPKNKLSVKFVNSNVDFLKYLQSTVNEKLHIDGSIYKETDKKYQLVYFTKSGTKSLLDSIYYNSDNQLLERKYEIYKSYYGSPA